jgi:hypothetical protein
MMRKEAEKLIASLSNERERRRRERERERERGGEVIEEREGDNREK